MFHRSPPPPPPPPPWQVLELVTNYLDPKTLAMASCVCKSWSLTMSSDHLWQQLCATHFPSLSNLPSAAFAAPYHRLYAIGYVSAKRRQQPPRKTHLSLDNLLLAITVWKGKNTPAFTVVKPGNELVTGSGDDRFRFDIDIDLVEEYGGACLTVEELKEVKVTCNVVLKGFAGVFTMMDCKGKGSFVSGGNVGWFSEELPPTVCCLSSRSGTMSGLVADMKLGLRETAGGGGRVVVGKVGVGILSIVSWRYVSVDDGLRYLQHFLLPCK